MLVNLVFNQFTESFSVLELANAVQKCGSKKDMNVEIQHMANYRNEAEDHYFNAKHTGLEGLGLKPIHLTEDILDSMIDLVIENRDYINQDCILPSVTWSRRSA